MTYAEAGELKDRARANNVQADRVGLPPRPGESLGRGSQNAVVFWLQGQEFEFTNVDEAVGWLTTLLAQRK